MIDQELLEFVTSPPSVQKLSPEMWVDAWWHVCRENSKALEMQPDARAGECPYCKVCKKLANMTHLLTPQCQEAREGLPAADPLLKAILAAEKKRRSRYWP